MPEYRSRQERRKAQTKNKGKRKKRGLFKKILLTLCFVIALGIIGGSIAVFAIIQKAPDLKPSLLDSPQTTTILDKEAKPVSKLYKQNRTKVDIGDVPKLQQEAVTSIEDRRFYKHFGIDIHRILGAAVDDLKKGRFAEGGSTITQQVIKRSFLTPKKTFVRKIQEAWLAIKLEQKYSKEQILDMYLNKIYYGERAYGIATASETYFGTKDLSKLNLAQMALLAGIPNAPSTYDPFTHPEQAAHRRDQVLHAMVKTGAINEGQAEKAMSIPIEKLVVKKKKDDKNKNDKDYQAFIDTVYRELVKEKGIISEKDFYQGGLKIYTTLDTDAQKHVYDLIHSDEINYPDEYFETGMALIDTQSGAVRAIGGGRKFKAISYTNYGSQVKNPTGSTMKPVIDYGPAIENLKWSTAHTLLDGPYTYHNSDKELKDWDGKHMGSMTLRNALAYSRNVPALKTMYAVGKDKAVKFAENLGLDFKKPVNDAAAIGSYEPGATPLQMAGAYAAFGNKGIYNEPYTVTKIVFPDGKTIKPEHKSHTAMHDYTAYMVTDVLKSVIDYGTGKSISLPGLPVAGKTGSVGLGQDFRDQHHISDTGGYSDEWFNGYTPQYTTSIWTGYPSLVTKNGKVHYMSTSASKNIAKQIFQKLMGEISGNGVSDWQQPSSVVNLDGELYVKGAKSTQEEIEKNKKPDAPKNLQAKYDKDDNQISLTWDYSDDDDVKFKVESSVDGQSNHTQDTDDHEATIDDPKPGKTYNIKVTAIKDDKNSDPAEASVEIPGDEDEQPKTPEGLKASYDEDHHLISVTWSYPDDQDDHFAFKVSYSVDGGSTQILGTTQNNQGVINDPKPGSTYHFKVVSVNTESGKTGDPATTSVQVPNNNDSEDNGDNVDQGDNGDENPGDNGDGNHKGGPKSPGPPVNGNGDNHDHGNQDKDE